MESDAPTSPGENSLLFAFFSKIIPSTGATQTTATRWTQGLLQAPAATKVPQAAVARQVLLARQAAQALQVLQLLQALQVAAPPKVPQAAQAPQAPQVLQVLQLLQALPAAAAPV